MLRMVPTNIQRYFCVVYEYARKEDLSIEVLLKLKKENWR